MSAALVVLHAVEIYDGRTHLGELAELKNGQFRATTRNGWRIGIFDNPKDAERAILDTRGREASSN